MGERIQALEEENLLLSQDQVPRDVYHKLERRATATHEQLDKIREGHAALGLEVSDLDAQLQEARNAYGQLKEQLDQVDKERASSETRARDAEASCDNLRRDLGTLREEIDATREAHRSLVNGLVTEMQRLREA